MSSKPEFLYKYKPVSTATDLVRAIQTIGGMGIYAALPSQLNDPMEGKGKILGQGFAGVSLILNSGRTPRHYLTDVNECRVLSLSTKPASPQMWAHYADGYKGVCFQFATASMPFEVSPVTYADKPGEPIHISELGTPESLKAAHEALLSKQSDWSYECEYRAIFDGNGSTLPENRLAPIGSPSALIIGGECEKVCADILAESASKHGIPAYETYIADNRYEIKILPYAHSRRNDGRDIEIRIREYCTEAGVPDSSGW